ncbi:MAG: TRAP transporter small permease [Gammaproteobacteria bacterium]|nr:TRAP transporter small permease [Gammaproteobacteria bacterium]MYI89785.1 TRAP transporter small permease [Gammaproteobacteria bacterium]
MKALIEGFDKNGERWLLLVFYAFVVTVIFVEVIRRFVFQYSSIWGEETARYAFIYLVWIGAAAAVKDRAHIRIDIIFKFLPDKAIAILYVLGDVITLIFACAALYWSLESVGTSIRFDAATHGLRMNQAWFTFAVPFGFSLILIRLVQSIRRDISDIRAGRPPFTGRKLFG